MTTRKVLAQDHRAGVSLVQVLEHVLVGNVVTMGARSWFCVIDDLDNECLARDWSRTKMESAFRQISHEMRSRACGPG